MDTLSLGVQGRPERVDVIGVPQGGVREKGAGVSRVEDSLVGWFVVRFGVRLQYREWIGEWNIVRWFRLHRVGVVSQMRENKSRQHWIE